MKIKILLIALAVIIGINANYANCEDTESLVYVLEIDNLAIMPTVGDFIIEKISDAEMANAECLVIELDTPGGLVDTTRDIVKGILNSQVPVIVYIAPGGARAGSAGVFITLSANIAAMAPSTNIGAAHPVMLTGQIKSSSSENWLAPIATPLSKILSLTPEHEREPSPLKEEMNAIMSKKVLNDTVAWIRAIAKFRGKNVEWAENAVRESVSITEEEAVAENVVDVTATSLASLLKKIDGKKVMLMDGEKTLNTDVVTIRRFGLTQPQKLLNMVVNPTIAMILGALGMAGLFFEITHPGFGFPGAAGIICIILSVFAFHLLPINYLGIILILLAIGLFIAEVKVQSFGLLALGGIVSFILGASSLIQAPIGFDGISKSAIYITAVCLAGITVFLVTLVVKAHQRKATTGNEGMLGETGKTATDIGETGKVFIHGEYWTARLEKPGDIIPKGEKVEVVGNEGLILIVKRKL